MHETEYVEAVKAAAPTRAHAGRWPAASAPRTPRPSARHARGRPHWSSAPRSRRPGRSGPATAEHAVNVAGGLHHAMPGAGSGFCVYNDPAIAIAWLLEQGAERVAYVDVDVHHGDGVERAFWDDPRVLTISLHESGRYALPRHRVPRGRRRPRRRRPRGQRGAAARHGRRRLAARASTPSCRRCSRSSRPQVLVTQHGCDSHVLDPLAHLGADRRRPARRRTPRCTTSRTASRAVGGWPPAAAATSSRRSCPGRGPTCSPRRPAPRPAGDRRCRRLAGVRRGALRAGRAAADDRRRDAGLAGLVGGLRPGRRRSTGRCWRPSSAVFPANGLGGLLDL